MIELPFNQITKCRRLTAVGDVLQTLTRPPTFLNGNGLQNILFLPCIIPNLVLRFSKLVKEPSSLESF